MEFALVAPVFLVLVLALIDFGGYFGARLSVENAARSGDRVATVQPYTSYSGSAIVTAVTSNANVALVPSTWDVDCAWSGNFLLPSSYPPFTFPTDKTACIGIWYFELTGSGSPWLCGQWSVSSQTFTWWSSAGVSGAKDGGCVTAPTGSYQGDLVVVGVGYRFSPLTPLPAIAPTALTTYGETQLLEEQ